MQTSLFDYELPPEHIAQAPIKPRDHSRLLALDRAAGTWTHHHFYDIGSFLKPGDLLVVNESKVFKARLHAQTPSRGDAVHRPGQDVELFLIRPEAAQWVALAKPGRKLEVDMTLTFDDGRTCRVISKRDDGTVIVDFAASTEDVIAWTDGAGEVPVPPYVDQAPSAAEDYQTVYAKTVGSVAAPTAGFHFTPELIEKLKAEGIHFATVTLHVGLGTFRPIKTDTLEEHQMHEEWISVPQATRDAIEETKKNGGRVIAVGTTTVRALESEVTEGFTNIFITPGYRFKVVDGLITNFHLPKSTLLVLVSTFAGQPHADPDNGRRIILDAYRDAIEKEYRFYSFGDAMFIF